MDVGALIKAGRYADAEAEIRKDLGTPASHRLLARALEGQGRRQEAVAALKEALRVDPNDADALHRLGLLFARNGLVERAIFYFERLTRSAPGRADAWANLGLALRAAGRGADAIAALDRALAIDPVLPVALAARGLLTLETDVRAAIPWLRRAVTAPPGRADLREAWIGLGRALRRTGDLDGAEAAFRAASPSADAAVRLVRLLLARGRLDAAVEAAESARIAHPTDPEVARVAGIASGRHGRPLEAVAHFQACIELSPEDGGAWANLASALWNTGAVAETIAAANRAIELAPQVVLGHHILGQALDSKKDAAAIVHLQQALSLAPDDDPIRCDLAHALRRDSRLDESIAQYHTILARHPDSVPALSGAGATSKDQGRAADAVAFLRRAHAIRPEDQAVWDNLLLAMHYDPGVPGAESREAHYDWGRHAESRPLAMVRPRKPGPIRVGYVSGDLGQHPVGAFLLGVLPAHDRQEFRVHVYSTRTNPDDYTRRFEAASDVWRDVVKASEAELTDTILADDIDVLVDLAGHTKGHRLGVFARKPARVQATWAGYVGTTGLSRIDWLIGDRVHTPNDGESIERVWRMPEGYVPYTPPITPDVAPSPSIRRKSVTFGCFNNVAKLSPPTIAAWRRVLEQVPKSRLLLLSHGFADRGVQAYFRGMFGAVADRVEMRGRVGHKTLMRTYAEEVDIGLDPFPYSGGVTTLEALWMGVPVITLGGGDRFCSRHTSGHLTAIGEPEGIARDPDDYVAKCVALATDQDRRVKERAARRPKLLASPVLDSPRFTRHLESAFRQMLAASGA